MSTASVNTAAPKTGQIFLYFGALTLIVYLATPQGNLADITTTYMLKNQLRAPVNQVAAFRLLTAIPVYFGFLFGLTRDLWSPFRLRDRGYFLIFGTATATFFIWMAFSRLAYFGLLAGMLLVMVSFRFSMAAYQALIALIGQEDLMTGRLSTLWNIFFTTPYAVGGVRVRIYLRASVAQTNLSLAGGSGCAVSLHGPAQAAVGFHQCL